MGGTDADRVRALLYEGAQALDKASALAQDVARAADMIIAALRDGHKLLLFGNGGSAADCQHIAGEMVGRFKLERPGLAAIALTTDTSILTAVANDYGFDTVFARQIEALGRAGDVALALSTSGNAPNVLAGVSKCRELGIATIGLTGRDGGQLAGFVDLCLRVPHDSTPIIQQVHIAIGHAICELVESALGAGV